ncbi:hypothetical protein OAT84_00355 [Gammaproteobacteria bacterium]|nr:hypothetical protein [Gammaproteobacteria bacterium]
MLVELILILISIYFIVLLWHYKQQKPEMFSEKSIVHSMGTLLWLAIALLFVIMISVTYLRML